MLDEYYHTDKFLYDVICCGKKIENDEQENEFDASYMAMCLLLPIDAFKKEIIDNGGLIEVSKNKSKIRKIAAKFEVSEKLVLCRIKSLMVTNNISHRKIFNYKNKDYVFFNSNEHIVTVLNNEKVLNENYKLIRIDEKTKSYMNIFPVMVNSDYYVEDTNKFGELFLALEENETFYNTHEHRIKFESIDDYFKDDNHLNYDLELGNNLYSNMYLNNTPVVSINNESGITLEENAKRKLSL